MKFAKTYIDGVKKSSDGRFGFTMSTPSVDRMGDVVGQDWDLRSFKRNPVALWQHNHNQPVGRWHDVKVVDGKLTGEIEFMPEEISPFAAQVGRMVGSGFLKAVSVGFIPKDVKPRKSGGFDLMKCELLECSIVSVPANAEALAYAKSFASPDQIRKLFADDGVSANVVRVRQAKARIKGLLATHGEIAVQTKLLKKISQ